MNIQATNIPTSQAILRRPQVQIKTGLSRSSIYALMQAGQFPKQVPLAGRAVGWVESEIDQFLNDRITAARQSCNVRGR